MHTSTEQLTEEDRIFLKIQEYAIECHRQVNQTYNGKPYSFHLRKVDMWGSVYSYLLPMGAYKRTRPASYTHDLVEDTGETYNDVKEECGYEIAEITYALSNEKGRTRDERANRKYYRGIRKIFLATFYKCCDRLANIDYSISVQSSMAKKYAKEHKKFKWRLYSSKYDVMFEKMEEMFIKAGYEDIITMGWLEKTLFNLRNAIMFRHHY